MRKCIVLGALCLLCLGCSSLDRAFVRSVNGYANVILPEYREYIQKDSSLSDDTRRIRTQTADKFRQLIDEAVKESGEGDSSHD